MVGSSCATVCYLHRHMKSMKEIGSPFSSPRLHSQMRVTIAGILQGILFLFTALWIFIHYSSKVFSSTSFDDNILYTVISLYKFGTTLNLGIGQAIYSASYLIMMYMAATSMSTSVWLNFFYYTQIVPAQRALFTWVKRNIKSIIYWGLFGDRMFFMFQFAVRATGVFYSSGEGPSNTTGFTSTNVLLHTLIASQCLKIIYVLFCLCVMVGSSCATVCYLHRHMKSMKEIGSPFSSPRLHSQMRVTIAGILQGILFLFTALWIFIHYSSKVFSSTSFDDNILYTVISLYKFGTTLNLGISQAVFRQRAADICLKAKQYWKMFFFYT
uniref:Taste receptor type 2 n=1 Tax=Oncorhynchus tshawytscha TaxID=74940 RepID=A0AAZ3P133_ONCTS